MNVKTMWAGIVWAVCAATAQAQDAAGVVCLVGERDDGVRVGMALEWKIEGEVRITDQCWVEALGGRPVVQFEVQVRARRDGERWRLEEFAGQRDGAEGLSFFEGGYDDRQLQLARHGVDDETVEEGHHARIDVRIGAEVLLDVLGVSEGGEEELEVLTLGLQHERGHVVRDVGEGEGGLRRVEHVGEGDRVDVYALDEDGRVVHAVVDGVTLRAVAPEEFLDAVGL